MSDLDAMPGTPGPVGCIGTTGPIMGNVVPIPPPATPNDGMTDEEARAVLKAAELSRSRRDARDLHRNDPNPPKNMRVDDANALIFSYFDRLKYPKVVEAKAVLLHELGSVFLVSFDTLPLERGKELRKPCYAVIVNGVVVGYNEDFWSDADKYKLILKCHLGLLQMDAHEAEKLKPPVAEKKVETPRASDETISAVIGRYEELLRIKDAQISAANTEAGEWMKKRADVGKLHDDLFFKIKRIEDVISGADEKEKVDLAKAKEALKDDPVACMIGANNNWFLGDEEGVSETQPNPCIEKDEEYLRSIPGQYATTDYNNSYSPGRGYSPKPGEAAGEAAGEAQVATSRPLDGPSCHTQFTPEELAEENLRDAVTRTVEIMIGEAIGNPITRSWVEDALKYWSKSFLTQLVGCPDNMTRVRILGSKCDNKVAFRMNEIWKSDVNEMNIFWRELARLISTNRQASGCVKGEPHAQD